MIERTIIASNVPENESPSKLVELAGINENEREF